MDPDKYAEYRWKPDVVYRVVYTHPPTLADIETKWEKQIRFGKPMLTKNPRLIAMANGLSVFESRQAAEDQARANAGKFGQFVAEIRVPANVFMLELTSGSGHWTLWENLNQVVPNMGDTQPVEGL